jgi:hypothetical protein
VRKGPVSSRVALLLRSAEGQPSFASISQYMRHAAVRGFGYYNSAEDPLDRGFVLGKAWKSPGFRIFVEVLACPQDILAQAGLHSQDFITKDFLLAPEILLSPGILAYPQDGRARVSRYGKSCLRPLPRATGSAQKLEGLGEPAEGVPSKTRG